MRAAALYSWPLAEMSMRHARRKNVPALPQTALALADFLEANIHQYTCCGHSFYQDRTIDDDGKVSIIFGCLDLIQEVIRQGGSELHADATFKVVPSSPKCRQLFVMHFNIQNHVSSKIWPNTLIVINDSIFYYKIFFSPSQSFMF